MKAITLNAGTQMPILGLGICQMSNAESDIHYPCAQERRTTEAVLQWLREGARIHTTQ